MENVSLLDGKSCSISKTITATSFLVMYDTIVRKWKLTWLFEKNLLDVWVIEMFMPVMPFSTSEAQMTTSHPEVCLCPVPGVGANRSPLALYQHLKYSQGFNNDKRYCNMDDKMKEVYSLSSWHEINHLNRKIVKLASKLSFSHKDPVA